MDVALDIANWRLKSLVQGKTDHFFIRDSCHILMTPIGLNLMIISHQLSSLGVMFVTGVSPRCR